MFLFGSLDFLVSMGIHLPEEISQLVDFPSPEGEVPPSLARKTANVVNFVSMTIISANWEIDDRKHHTLISENVLHL